MSELAIPVYGREFVAIMVDSLSPQNVRVMSLKVLYFQQKMNPSRFRCGRGSHPVQLVYLGLLYLNHLEQGRKLH